MPQGFIHDELDVKLLILYIMSRVAGPVDFATLTDLTLCDSGVDYFLYAQALSDLVKSGHLRLVDGFYAATEKGRDNSATLESGLPSIIRRRCDQSVSQLNHTIRRAAQVTAQVQDDGRLHAAALALSDEAGPLLELKLTAPSQDLAQQIADNFQLHPVALYNQLLALLLTPQEEVDP